MTLALGVFVLVEHLNVVSLVWSVIPWLLTWRGGTPEKIYYIDASAAGLWAAGILKLLWRLPCIQLDFRLIDVRDTQGRLISLRISSQDLIQVREWVASNPELSKAFRQAKASCFCHRMDVFLKKEAVIFSWNNAHTSWRMIFLVQLIEWHLGKQQAKNVHRVLIANKRFWFKELSRYAAQYGVTVVQTPYWQVNWRVLLTALVGANRIKAMYYRYLARGMKNSRSVLSAFDHQPRLMVEYYGLLNLDQQEFYSDLFFWQQSELKGEDLLIALNLPRVPIGHRQYEAMRKHGMSVVSLNPKATTLDQVPLFIYDVGIPAQSLPFDMPGAGVFKFGVGRWLKEALENYLEQYHYWSQLFSLTNTKIYVTWYKYDASHCAIADAVQSCGGVSALYQRAFADYPSADTAVAADIFFGFSSYNAHVEQASGSRIPYFVVAGYTGDHRKPYLAPLAQKIRQQLQSRGARKIIAFFDENSKSDTRWYAGHNLTRDNYRFLLERVLEDESLGLVMKPKIPSTLRERLGPVAGLLTRAEATGRCYVFEEGMGLHGAYPPLAAALAADLAIHGHLCAATAGIESALAGVPTLLFDGEGLPESIFHKKLGRQVVFSDWEELWRACQEHWPTHSRLGDWGPLLDELDPFRDGGSAKRIGTYLNWMMDAFKKGGRREDVLADCAQRYMKSWGQDKIIRVNA